MTEQLDLDKMLAREECTRLIRMLKRCREAMEQTLTDTNRDNLSPPGSRNYLRLEAALAYNGEPDA